MHRRTILAIARKDALDILLNKSTLMVLLSPIIVAVLFAFINGVFANKTTKLLIFNPGNSAVEQVLVGAYQKPEVVRADSLDEVAAQFGPDGAKKSSDYVVGLVVPSDFEASLRAGGHPQVGLYVNGDQVDNQQRQLLMQAITDYSRSVANPQPPASIALTTINPPKPNSALQDLGSFYAAAALLTSFMIGTSLVPGLLVEEKEKKTLRMLMVSPASWGDIIASKLLVGLTYQVVLSLVILAVVQGFFGQVPLVLLFLVLGALFGGAIGLLMGSIFKTQSATGALAGMVSFLFLVPSFFVGPLGQLFQGSPVTNVMKAVPTYYLAEGIINALGSQTTPTSLTLDAGIVGACIVVLFVGALWALRRQAAVVSTI
jgi:ABC-2 type transport system permease protein